MNPINTLIVSLVSLLVLLQSSPNEACMNKIRTLLKNKGKEEKPATLYQDESAYIRQSNSQTEAPLYIEIRQRPNKSLIIRELNHPPIAMSQTAGDDLKEKINGSNGEGDKTQSQEMEPPQESSQEAASKGEAKGDGEPEEEILSPEDENIRREWGGKCTTVEWNQCNKIRAIVVKDVIHTPFQRKSLDLDCLVEPILCLRNGWTANRCHILCMAQCNVQLFFDWDGVVDFEGPCRYKK